MIKKLILFFVLCAFLSGCAILRHKDQLLTLKRLGDDQARQEKSIKIQEKRFQVLLLDYERGRLKKGTTRRRILSRYGEPISMKGLEGDPYIAEQFAYRHPEEIFGSEKVYLFFDKDSKLIDWQYYPAVKKNQD
ncbi:MAG: hypothetical protein ABH954_05135 [Candidatus Omnitrophota bacterium]